MTRVREREWGRERERERGSGCRDFTPSPSITAAAPDGFRVSVHRQGLERGVTGGGTGAGTIRGGALVLRGGQIQLFGGFWLWYVGWGLLSRASGGPWCPPRPCTLTAPLRASATSRRSRIFLKAPTETITDWTPLELFQGKCLGSPTIGLNIFNQRSLCSFHFFLNK